MLSRVPDDQAADGRCEGKLVCRFDSLHLVSGACRPRDNGASLSLVRVSFRERGFSRRHSADRPRRDRAPYLSGRTGANAGRWFLASSDRVARELAVEMAFEDMTCVADLKICSARFYPRARGGSDGETVSPSLQSNSGSPLHATGAALCSLVVSLSL